MESPRDFILPFQSPAETFSIISIKIDFPPCTHTDYYGNIPFNFFFNKNWKCTESLIVTDTICNFSCAFLPFFLLFHVCQS